MIVISLCDRTGIMVQPWLEAGYDAITLDLLPAIGPIHPKRKHVIWDVRSFSPHKHMSDIAIVFAFPPCTDLAISGAKYFKDKGLKSLINALTIVEDCREICENSGAPWMIENPIGTLATYWRAPDHSFDPCDYGDPYTKRTCIWCGNGFIMPPKIAQYDLFEEPTMVEPTLGSLIYNMPDTQDRTEKRNATPIGFAYAVFKSNHRQRQVCDEIREKQCQNVLK